MAESMKHRDWALEPSPSEQDEIAALAQQQQDEPLMERENSNNSLLEHIGPVGRAELTRVASNFPRRKTSGFTHDGSGIERKDTLEGLEPDDPVFNPSNEKFDHYKWARMLLKLLDKEGIPRTASTGIIFENLNVSGSGSALQYQNNVGSLLLAPFRMHEYLRRPPVKQILRNFDGLLRSGELLLVLGRPGSGCSTLLKVLTGELHGLKLRESSEIQYNGIPMEKMHKEFKGEVLYNQEVDRHFPHLTVGQTLEFAAGARTPDHRLKGISRKQYSKHVSQVAMAVFGLSHTYSTKGMLKTSADSVFDSNSIQLATNTLEVCLVVKESVSGSLPLQSVLILI